MKLRTILLLAVAALLVVPAAAGAQQPGKKSDSGFKVTGGGQIIAEDTQGPGDTVGFNAQELIGDDPRSTGDDDDAARGQFQYVPRGQSGNESAPEDKFHGVVTCLISGGEAVENEADEDDGNVEEALKNGMARFGGYFRDDPTRFFTVDVTDNGQGGDSDDDMILVRLTAEPCADNPEDEDNEAEEQLRLGRGNVKIHNNPDPPAAVAVARIALG